MDAWYLFHSVVEMHGVYDHCGKQVEPEIGEIPVAFVANAKGSELTEDDVKQFVAKEVIYYKKVREVTFVDKIPKAPSGKILRKELRKQLQQQQQVV